MLDGENTESSWGSAGGESADLNSIDVDSLVNDSGGDLSPAPEKSQTQTAQPTDNKTAAQVAAEIAFKANGKEIRTRLDDPRATQWLSQGYDYAQRMAEFNQQQAAFKAQQAEIEAVKNRYSEVEDYITKNPEWWTHVQSQYEQAKAQGLGSQNPNNPEAMVLNKVREELKPVFQFIQTQEQQAKAAKQQQEDTALDGEIKSVREAHGTLDWNTPDENGLNLELRVLKHAQEKGISNFEAAFLHLMREPLMKMEREKAMAEAVKERQKQTKLGLLDKSSTPKRGLTDAQGHKNKTYDQLLYEGLEELGFNAG